MTINPYSIPPFIVSLITLLLGIFVYLKNKRSKQNIIYFFFNFSIFLWLFFAAALFSLKKNEILTNFICKMVFVGVTFIPITFYHFFITFTGFKKQKNLIKVFYIIGVMFVLVLFSTNLYISGNYQFFWGCYPKGNIVLLLDVAFYAGLYSSTLILLYKEMRVKQLDMHRKKQIKLMLTALFIGGLACIDYVPNCGYEIYPFGYIFILIMTSIFAYTIVKHQLMDIEVIIKKTLIFGGLFAVVYTVFAFFALLGQVFFERFVTQNRWLSMIPSVVVVTLMSRPLENFLEAVTDRYLFQKKYNYKELLKTFTSEILTVLELDKLIDLTKRRLSEIMKIKNCDIVLGQQIAVTMEANVPITFHDKTIGTLLLGKKKSDEGYTQDDYDILQPLSKALGIAISNARLFDELSKTRMKMAEKDKMATIGTLAAGMAHEIRNPITTIRNFADYLPEKHNDAGFTGKFIKLIPREIDRIESIARSLLEFSSSEDTDSIETFAIDEPVHTIISILEPQYRTSEIEIVCGYKEKRLVKGHKVQIQDALFNILNYILAESPKGSKVSVECAEGEYGLTLYMKNSGVVISEHIIKDVFEPVSGEHKEKRGFGFNLFVAKQLLERNGATFSIFSNKKIGSEFRVYFKKSISAQPS